MFALLGSAVAGDRAGGRGLLELFHQRQALGRVEHLLRLVREVARHEERLHLVGRKSKLFKYDRNFILAFVYAVSYKLLNSWVLKITNQTPLQQQSSSRGRDRPRRLLLLWWRGDDGGRRYITLKNFALFKAFSPAGATAPGTPIWGVPGCRTVSRPGKLAQCDLMLWQKK